MTSVSAIEGRNIKLECNLPRTDPPRIRWTDYVFNTNRNPILIYDSTIPGFNQDHSAKDNFQMDHLDLIITSVDLFHAGEYFCESEISDGVTLKQTFDLTVTSK